MDRSQLNLRVPASELVMWRQAAVDSGDTLSTWVRIACNVALAQQALDSGREFDGRDVVVTPTPMAPLEAPTAAELKAASKEAKARAKPVELLDPVIEECKHLRRMQTNVVGRIRCDETKGGCGRFIR